MVNIGPQYSIYAFNALRIVGATLIMETVCGPYNGQNIHIINIGNNTMDAHYLPTHNIQRHISTF